VTDTGICVSTLASDSSLRGLIVGASFLTEGALPPRTPGCNRMEFWGLQGSQEWAPRAKMEITIVSTEGELPVDEVSPQGCEPTIKLQPCSSPSARSRGANQGRRCRLSVQNISRSGIGASIQREGHTSEPQSILLGKGNHRVEEGRESVIF
jgi:hypothetical protein